MRKNQTNPPHTTKRKQENMNKKMLLSAFAAVAVSAASADIFSWTLSGYGVTGETKAEIWAVPDYASSDLNYGVQIRTDKDVAQGAFASTNYRWQDGVLQAYHADKTTWYDVYRLDFTFDRDGGTASMAASWADVLAKVKTEGKYTRTMGWGDRHHHPDHLRPARADERVDASAGGGRARPAPPARPRLRTFFGKYYELLPTCGVEDA